MVLEVPNRLAKLDRIKAFKEANEALVGGGIAVAELAAASLFALGVGLLTKVNPVAAGGFALGLEAMVTGTIWGTHSVLKSFTQPRR